MLDIFEEFRGLVTSLSARGIDYALCGGLAMAVHAAARATVDIDILIRPEDLAAAKSCAHDLGYTFEAAPMSFKGGDVEIRRVSKPDVESGDTLMVDLLLVTKATEEAWRTRERVPWDHGEIFVVSRQKMKVDMSPHAVTIRLLRTAQLRRLCLSLRNPRREPRHDEAERRTPVPGGEPTES
jgi:hypothetical protein